MKRQIKLSEGEKLGRSPNCPVAAVVGSGPDAYLWVGNDAPNDLACFATLSGRANLRRLANGILKAIAQRPAAET